MTERSKVKRATASKVEASEHSKPGPEPAPLCRYEELARRENRLRAAQKASGAAAQ